MLVDVLAVVAGGGIGAALRYLATLGMGRLTAGAPWGTALPLGAWAAPALAR